ncbi:chaperone modulator CbpM [Yoonia sediminilitoris]|uniref:Chaperone modulatory protein CbpM n=1 Tax=Yoonia sediminilitoris TaxID=1286148 RepID=A0A2T6KIX1_9RHOB|nr:chaperone modulator CbpM [Yoonia sediminilitoris]PUB15611.1 chaperone modulatory protein CbpM [Yoonia sediminilitoris]RCW96220.1 chaperone modulatory protein CbpM [Yoonia sediminilitoris]
MKKAVKRNPSVDMIETLTLSELTIFCDTNADWVLGLVEHGIVTPIAKPSTELQFEPAHIARARKASRLMRDLGLNFAGVGLVLDLIEERDALARKLAMFDTYDHA